MTNEQIDKRLKEIEAIWGKKANKKTSPRKQKQLKFEFKQPKAYQHKDLYDFKEWKAKKITQGSWNFGYIKGVKHDKSQYIAPKPTEMIPSAYKSWLIRKKLKSKVD
jgi:hypothetical protein